MNENENNGNMAAPSAAFSIMSEELQERLRGEIESLGKAVGWVRILIAAAFLFGGWIATLEYRVQEHHDRVKDLPVMLNEIKGNRFTSLDWMKANENIQDKFNNHDKRLLLLEGKLDAATENSRKASENSAQNTRLLMQLIEETKK